MVLYVIGAAMILVALLMIIEAVRSDMEQPAAEDEGA